MKAAFLPITDIGGFSAIASTGTEQQAGIAVAVCAPAMRRNKHSHFSAVASTGF